MVGRKAIKKNFLKIAFEWVQVLEADKNLKASQYMYTYILHTYTY